MKPYIRYKTFGRFTVYVGRVGSGKTLGAVIHLYKLSKTHPELSLVSNHHLTGIPYEPFDIDKLNTYKDKIVFIDLVETYSSSRKYKDSVWKVKFFLDRIKNNNCYLITTSPDTSYFSAPILVHISTIVDTRYYRGPHPQLRLARLTLKSRKHSIKFYLLKGVKRYFKFYNTREIIRT